MTRSRVCRVCRRIFLSFLHELVKRPCQQKFLRELMLAERPMRCRLRYAPSTDHSRNFWCLCCPDQHHPAHLVGYRLSRAFGRVIGCMSSLLHLHSCDCPKRASRAPPVREDTAAATGKSDPHPAQPSICQRRPSSRQWQWSEYFQGPIWREWLQKSASPLGFHCRSMRAREQSKLAGRASSGTGAQRWYVFLQLCNYAMR